MDKKRHLTWVGQINAFSQCKIGIWPLLYRAPVGKCTANEHQTYQIWESDHHQGALDSDADKVTLEEVQVQRMSHLETGAGYLPRGPQEAI